MQIAQAWCGHGEEEEKESCIAGVQQHDQWSMVIDHLPQSNPKLNGIFSKQISDCKRKKGGLIHCVPDSTYTVPFTSDIQLSEPTPLPLLGDT